MLSQRSLVLADAIRRTAPVASAKSELKDLADLRARLGRPLRVGVARVDGIGDWILTLPLVEALRASDDVAEITLFAPPGHRSLLARPGVAFEPIDLWALHHTPWPHGTIGKALALSAIGQTRAERVGRSLGGSVDLLVLPRWDPDRGQNLRFFGVGMGVYLAGHDPVAQPQASAKERREGRVLSLACTDRREFVHESARVEALVNALGLEPVKQPLAARSFYGMPKQRVGHGRPVVTMHTGAHDSFRRWPEQHWAELIAAVLQASDSEVILIGDRNDATLHARLCAADPSRVSSTAGITPLADLPGELDRATVFVGGDSGPAHVAAAIGLPTVVISCFPEGDDQGHPNNPDRFAARSEHGGVIRPGPQAIPFAEMPAAQRDAVIALVTPGQVWAELAQLL